MLVVLVLYTPSQKSNTLDHTHATLAPCLHEPNSTHPPIPQAILAEKKAQTEALEAEAQHVAQVHKGVCGYTQESGVKGLG